MIKVITCYIAILTTTIQIVLPSQPGYYWREYTGVIPFDAFSAGKDVNRNPIYIGQAYLHGKGVIPGQINTGEKEIIVGYNGHNVMKKHIRILCGQPDDFKWVRTSKQNFTGSTPYTKKTVVGGFDWAAAKGGSGIIGVGRVSYLGGDRVGKINSWPQIGPWTFGVTQILDKESGKTIVFETYEMLTYV